MILIPSDNSSPQGLVQYIESCLASELDTNGESTYTNAFKAELHANYLDITCSRPGTFVLDSLLYKKIEKILTADLFPYITILPSNGMHIVDTNSGDISTARALRFYFKRGIAKRLHYDSLDDCKIINENGKKYIPLMENYLINVTNGLPHIALSGMTGSGKTICALVLLQFISQIGDITIIDPKGDPYLMNWANTLGIPYFTPGNKQSDTAFMDLIQRELKKALDFIQSRQRVLQENPNYQFEPYVLYIDEAMALTVSLPKKIRDTYLGLIDKICLMGRQTNVCLFIASQTFEANTVISSSARDQMGLKILLTSNVNRENCRYLFKELTNPESIVIPDDGFFHGKGIIQNTKDGLTFPFLVPQIKTLYFGGIQNE